jgi:hypothetical protein
MFEVDLLNLNGRSTTPAQSVSPYATAAAGYEMAGADREYRWNEVGDSPGTSILGSAPMRNVERTVPIFVRARFSTAITNLLTNPRPYLTITGWATQGTGSTVTLDTSDFESVAKAVTTGSANSGMKHEFTGTAAAYSAGVWVKVASGTAPLSVHFDSGTATLVTATTSWQFVKTENITLTAATRSLRILQTDTGSRTIYVKLAGVHLGSTYAGYVDGACGDGRWNGTAHASTSTSLTGQDAVNLAIGRIGEKGEKAIATAGTGGLAAYWLPRGASYRTKIYVRAIDRVKTSYDYSHSNNQTASVEVKLTCHPYGQGPEYLVGTATKAIGLSALEMTITGAKGDIPGPCRVVITAGPQNQNFAYYGIQARDYSAGNSLTLAATSMGVSGYSGTLTAAANGVQQLTKTGTISGGTWSLGFAGYTFSASFAHNASTATVQSAIDTALGTANLFVVSGNPLSTGNMVFTASGGSLAGQYIPPLTFSGSSLTGGGSVALSTTTAGNPAYVGAALYDSWTAICDTGNLTHTGDYRVFARVYDASSTSDLYAMNLRIRWGNGDLTALQTNDAQVPQAVGDYTRIDLGQIHLPTAPTGTQRWNGIIEGKTSGTAASVGRVVRFEFVPMERGVGEVRSVDSGGATLSMLENFGATSGVLTGDTATSGQTWASMGGVTDADDFTETAAPDNSVIRTAVSDNASGYRYGRGVVLGSSTPTDVIVEASVTQSALVVTYQGILARFVDSSNFLLAIYASSSAGGGTVFVTRMISGSDVSLGSTIISVGCLATKALSLTVLSTGAWSLAVNGTTALSGTDSNLATGGTLASGKSGLYDYHDSASASTRTYSNFTVSVPATAQSAIYASQDLEFRPNEIVREIAAGGVYGVPAVSSQPFQPELVPAGSEGITNRLLIGTSRSNPDLGPDTFPDAFTANVWHTPVYDLARSES